MKFINASYTIYKMKFINASYRFKTNSGAGFYLVKYKPTKDGKYQATVFYGNKTLLVSEIATESEPSMVNANALIEKYIFFEK